MKKIIITLGLTSTLIVSSVFADALKNSLNNMLQQKDSSGMVNLNGIGVGAKPKRKVVKKMVRRKSRPSSAVIGHYNDGKEVHKKEADKYIKKVTKGKIKDLDLLPKKQRLLVLKDLQKIYAMKHFKSRPATAIVATVNGRQIRKISVDNFLSSVTGGNVKDIDRLDKKQQLILIKDFAKPILVAQAAESNLTAEEKETIFTQMWLEKQRASTLVTNDEMMALYEAKKAKAIAADPNAKIPPYISLGQSLQNEILEKKMMSTLMKDVNITISEENNETHILHDSNKSLEKLDKIANTKEK